MEFYDLYDIGSVLNLLDGNCSDLEGLESGDEIEDEAPSKRPTRIGADVAPRNEELTIQDDAEIQEPLLQAALVLHELPSLQVAPVQSAPILNEINQAGEQVNQLHDRPSISAGSDPSLLVNSATDKKDV
ncbi:uncharacterized protein LOC142322920 [Lycorma delicatula]|uniref:uncharacterized protein LOC142322920 n=1 Tax=Lycorma delicatula TaxID=130591 RepID=UPI003F5154CA